MSGTETDRDDNDSGKSRGKSKKAGAGTGAGSGGGGEAGDDFCDIREPAPLNSPKPAVVEQLKVHDVLKVVADQSGDRPILKVVDSSGNEAGSLTHRNHAAILDCIELGNSYIATVIEKAGGAVTVLIERA